LAFAVELAKNCTTTVAGRGMFLAAAYSGDNK
jgi:hypothetical protein